MTNFSLQLEKLAKEPHPTEKEILTPDTSIFRATEGASIPRSLHKESSGSSVLDSKDTDWCESVFQGVVGYNSY